MNSKTSFENHYSITDPYGHKKWYSESKRIGHTLSLVFDLGITFDNALELACGEGDISRQMLTVCRKLTAVDISGNALNRARKLNEDLKDRVQFVEGDAYEMDLPSSGFDLINGMESLHYAKDRPKQISRWIDWLKPGGYILFSGANRKFPYYSYTELETLFQRPELEILRFEPVNTKFPTQYLQNRGLLPQTDLVWQAGMLAATMYPKVFAKVIALLARKKDRSPES